MRQIWGSSGMSLKALKKMIRQHEGFKEFSERTRRILGYDLRDFVPRQAPLPDTDKNPLQKAGNAWDQWQQTIRQEWQSNPLFFLRDPAITITLHPNEQEIARLYFDELVKNPFFMDRLYPRLCESPFGNPYLCSFFPYASPQSMQHVYYLAMMKKHFGFFAPEEAGHITEIGGGYGNMCRLMYHYGYNNSYTIFDLAAMLELQRHYLGHTLPGNRLPETLSFSADLKGLTPPSSKKSLLMATFSFNEMPVDTRDQIEPYFKHYDHLFIAYNSAFDGIDNHDYFQQLEPRLAQTFDVQSFKDEHRRAWFVLGTKRT